MKSFNAVIVVFTMDSNEISTNIETNDVELVNGIEPEAKLEREMDVFKGGKVEYREVSEVLKGLNCLSSRRNCCRCFTFRSWQCTERLFRICSPCGVVCCHSWVVDTGGAEREVGEMGSLAGVCGTGISR